jgi:hypothetical protein
MTQARAARDAIMALKRCANVRERAKASALRGPAATAGRAIR